MVQFAEVDAVRLNEPVTMTSVASPRTRGPSTLRNALTTASSATNARTTHMPAEHLAQPPQRGLEVLRLLAGHARRVPPAGGAHLGRGEVDFLVSAWSSMTVMPRSSRRSATGRSRRTCRLLAISSSWVPRPTTSPSSSTRMLSAVAIVDTRCATMTTAASRVYGTSAARRRASVARSRAENESSNT